MVQKTPKTPKILSKADIFKHKGRVRKTVHVAEWGGDVPYHAMSMKERRQCRKKSSITTKVNGEEKIDIDHEKLELWAIITCVLDPEDENKLMFEPGDFDTLEGEMAAGGISTVSQAILGDSGMTGNAAFRSEEDTPE
tara:strand:+ start:484 stop:897 length:414 start_codon:yes stop_codon:yes gene_type:complete